MVRRFAFAKGVFYQGVDFVLVQDESRSSYRAVLPKPEKAEKPRLGTYSYNVNK